MKVPLTDEQKAEYLASPLHCPQCKSLSISSYAHHSQITDKEIRVPCSCMECPAEWVDVYTLTSIEET